MEREGLTRKKSAGRGGEERREHTLARRFEPDLGEPAPRATGVRQKQQGGPSNELRISASPATSPWAVPTVDLSTNPASGRSRRLAAGSAAEYCM